MIWNLPSGTLTNDGTIASTGVNASVAINANGAVLDTIINNGTISATGTAIQIGLGGTAGSVGPIVNNGLLYSPGGVAIVAFANGSMDTLTNTGTIYGGVINRSTISNNALTIIGVTDGSDNFGTFTSAGRTIESEITGVRFAAGNILLDMNVDVGSTQTVTNAGASLKFINNRTIYGHFSQTAGKLIFAAKPTATITTFPRLKVTGAASLTGGTIVMIPDSALNADGTYTIIGAAGGMTNAAQAAAAGYNAETTVSGNDLLITLSALPPPDDDDDDDGGGGGDDKDDGGKDDDKGGGGKDDDKGGGGKGGNHIWTTKAKGARGQAVPIGPVLDKLTTNRRFSGLIAALTLLPDAPQKRALRQLGTPTLVTKAGLTDSSYALSVGAIGQRQASLMASLPAGKAAGSAADSTQAWGQLLGNRASLDSTSRSGGFRSSAYGLALGADTRLHDDLVVGGAFSWIHSDLDGTGFTDGNEAKLDSYQLSAYGSWRPNGGRLFFDGVMSVGRNQFEQKRAVEALMVAARANYRGWQGLLKLGAGVDVPIHERLVVTPYANLQISRLENNGYRERGADVASLTVSKVGYNNVESELGVRLSTATETSAGRLTGDWQAGWTHAFTNKAVTTTASMGG